jgi:PAS domain-containing protein
MESDGEMRNEEYVMRRKDGSDARGRRQRPGGARQARPATGFEGTIADITERKKAETAVFEAKERAQVTLQSIGDAVITTDSRRAHRLHESGRRELTGWENREAQRRRSATC